MCYAVYSVREAACELTHIRASGNHYTYKAIYLQLSIYNGYKLQPTNAIFFISKYRTRYLLINSGGKNYRY